MDDVRLYWRFLRSLCRWFSVLHLRFRCYGMHHVPRRGAAVLVCNHQSFMDPVIVSIALPREAAYMARDTLFRNRLFRALISSLNAYPVRRGNADVGAIKESLRRLKQGQLLVLFPEGTRTVDGRIMPMMPGLGAIARKAGVPIVPTLIDGLSQVWPRDAVIPRPGNVVVEYGTPIHPEEYAGLSAEALTERIRDRLLAMQHRWHSRVPARRLQWYAVRADQTTYRAP